MIGMPSARGWQFISRVGFKVAGIMALDQLLYRANALVRLRRGQEAVNMLENALPTWRRASGDNPDHTQAAFLHFLAFSYVAVGRYVDAERTATEYRARVEGKLAPNARMIGFGHLVLGQALAGQRRYREAFTPTTQQAFAQIRRPARWMSCSATRSPTASGWGHGPGSSCLRCRRCAQAAGTGR